MYDLVIVGGGPAGATFARLIGNKFKVLLIEKRRFDESAGAERKCCGGLIAPDAQKMLAVFNMGLPGSVILSPQLFSVRTIDFDNNLERFYQRHYINIDREKFDLWLLNQLPSAVEKKIGCVYRNHKILKDHVEVRYTCGGKLYKVKGKYIIGADGAFSKVRRSSFPAYKIPPKYVSIQQWFKNKNSGNYYGAIFDKSITDFYSWTIPKDDELVLGSAINFNSNIWERFESLKTKMKNYGFNFNKPTYTNGAYVLRPKSARHIHTGSERVILVGEAAGFISPSSAEGLSYCFKSALFLAKAFNDKTKKVIDSYNSSTAVLKNNILCKNLKSPGMYNKFIRKAVMKTGIMSIKMEEGFMRDNYE